MKLIFFIFTVFFLSSSFSHGQNLIKNPQFDEYYNYYDKNGNLVYYPKHWHYVDSFLNHPIYYSTDRYLNKAIKQNLHPDSASINRGEIANYISLTIIPDVQRAYTVLEQPLEAGKNYRFNIDIKAFRKSNFFADLLVGFKDTVDNRMDSCLYQLRLVIPDSLCFENLYFQWLTLTTNFEATGKEKVVVISSGSPLDYKKMIDSNIDKFMIISMGGPRRLRYVIDNLSLTKIENETEKLYTAKYDSLKAGEKIILNNIYFDFNRSELRNDSFDELDKLKKYLELHKNTVVQISGHTDNFGTAEYNDKLSLDRAKAVVDYLINKGISQERLIYKGFGEGFPISDNDTSDGRQKNRRIEVLVTRE